MINHSRITHLLKKYPDRVPVIVTLDDKIVNRFNLNKELKFMVPFDTNVCHFMKIVRSKINIDETHGLFIFINNTLPKMTDSIYELYKLYNIDQCLYIDLKLENTFG